MRVMLFLMLMLLAVPPVAAEESISLQNAEANALYQQLLNNPTDRSLNLRYATLAAREGDYESAIPPLERLLAAHPGDPWLQLQLGKLYHALDSKMMAAQYLQDVLSNTKASAEMVSEAEQALKGLSS